MSKRDYIPLKVRLAAALCTLVHEDEEGRLVPIIPHDHAKLMDAEQVLSLFQWDHFPVAKAIGGSDAHWNLRPRLIKEHREKTAKVDRPAIDRAKRLEVEHEAFKRRVLAKSDEAIEERRQASKLKSGGFRGWRKFNGSVVSASNDRGDK